MARAAQASRHDNHVGCIALDIAVNPAGFRSWRSLRNGIDSGRPLLLGKRTGTEWLRS